MKIYEVTTIKANDEFQTYLGTDLKEAEKALNEARDDFDRLSDYDKAQSEVEGRIYEIDDDTDLTDSDELVNAICDCTGYDLMK